MGKKVISWVCVVLPLAFVGLVFMQVRWIMDAYELRGNQFDQIVFKCIDNVVARLETDEIMELRMDRGSSPARDPSVFMRSRGDGASAATEEIALTFKLDNFGFYKLDATRAGALISADAGVVDVRNVFGDDMVSNAYMMLSNVLLRKLRYLHAKQAKSVFESKPIEVRVNPQRLDALLMQQFADNGISAAYEFAVFNSAGQMSFSSPAYRSAADNAKVYEKRLYPNDVHARSHFVRVYFPESPDIVSGLAALIVPTLFFGIVVLLLSTFTVVTVFRQKKLDDIKNDFISNMTHEFKTPISTMSLAAQMLRDLADNVKPDFIRRNTAIIIDEGKRLTMQVEKILQMASFDRGKGRLKMEPHDVNEIVAKVVNSFRVKVESVNGEINERLEAAPAVVNVDELHFTNVVFNLLDNAFKYRRDAPMLNVWTHNANGGVVISVKDNGMGISKDDLKRIFEKFYRVSTGNRHDIKGFGLGLAYVKKIVEDMGGKISVESELSVGTKFDIYLPLIK